MAYINTSSIAAGHFPVPFFICYLCIKQEGRKITNSILIFGCSDRILTIEKQLPALIENNPTIGLNAFPLYYKTDFWLWIDNPKFGNCVYKKENSSYKKYFPFEPNVDLTGAYTVASFALDFAARAGYKKAVLFGILDGEYIKSDTPCVHAGHIELSYKHFYDRQDKTVNMMKLQQFKAIINSYRNKIDIEIPFGTI